MSMYHEDENIGQNTGRRIAAGCLIASFAVFVILGATLLANSRTGHKNNANITKTVSEGSTETETVEIGTDTLTSGDLDFWHMYDKDKNTVVSGADAEDGQKKPGMSDNAFDNNTQGMGNKPPLSGNGPVSGNSVSDNQFNVSESGEEPKYVDIIDTLPKSSYFSQGFKKDGDKLVYALNGHQTSLFGIDVSKYNGDIDWAKVKNAGVKYAMLRVGARGYSTGKVSIDDNFQKNYDGCSSNGIDTGVYFFSQATNVNEAIEEANYCIAALNGRNIKYPVVFDSEAVENDSYRTQNMSASELSACAIAFCTTIKSYGYIPMIGGTKKQLCTHMDLKELTDYDIWLYDTDETCVYPYRYNMRQYLKSGKIDGISGNVDYDICFISYADK